MAKYTTQIRSIVESGTSLFDFDYPIFDSVYRPVLEQKIIDHYYFREIGLETVAQFKHFLKSKLNIIMPYYNEQYEALSVFKTYDPYINKDLTTTEKRDITQDNENETSSNVETIGSNTMDADGTDKDIFSDTPQAKLSGLDYATNLTDSASTSHTEQDTTDSTTGTTTGKGNVTTTDEYLQHIKGFDGMKYTSDVYKDVRETIINIDQLIIEELNDLFMNIY